MNKVRPLISWSAPSPQLQGATAGFGCYFRLELPLRSRRLTGSASLARGAANLSGEKSHGEFGGLQELKEACKRAGLNTNALKDDFQDKAIKMINSNEKLKKARAGALEPRDICRGADGRVHFTLCRGDLIVTA